MDTSTTPPSTAISLPSGVETIEDWLTSLRADSHALPSHQRERDLEKLTLGICGLKLGESLAKWDPESSCWRTFQVSLFPTTEGLAMLEPLSGSFPNSGMTVGGDCFPQPELEPRTSGTGGGVLPMLDDWPGHIPSPTVSDVYTGNLESSQQKDGVNHSVTLPQWATRFPTPSTMDHIERQGMRPSRAATGRTTGYLSETISGQLNPDFVSWLMGVPQGWVSLEPLPPEHWQRWLTEPHWANGEWPGVPRVATGVKDRVSMLKALGNGIVPACVAEFLRRLNRA